jgi:hypothetical protein
MSEPGKALRIVRLANYVGPRSGGMRTALRELGAGYLAAGHEPVLVIPGRRRGDEQTAQGRVITRYGPIVPFTGGYRALLSRRRIAALLAELRPDRLEVSDRTTLRWTGRWAREHAVPAVMVSHESLTGLFSLPADVSGMSRWRSRLLSNAATPLADALNRRSVRDYQWIVCTTRWAAAEFERIGAPNLTRLPLGVDLELFSPERYSDAARDGYAAPGQTLLVHCGGCRWKRSRTARSPRSPGCGPRAWTPCSSSPGTGRCGTVSSTPLAAGRCRSTSPASSPIPSILPCCSPAPTWSSRPDRLRRSGWPRSRRSPAARRWW